MNEIDCNIIRRHCHSTLSILCLLHACVELNSCFSAITFSTSFRSLFFFFRFLLILNHRREEVCSLSIVVSAAVTHCCENHFKYKTKLPMLNSFCFDNFHINMIELNQSQHSSLETQSESLLFIHRCQQKKCLEFCWILRNQ